MTPDKKVEPAPLVPPFVRYVASAIPMVFDDSLSYYECLAALTKYLQEVVKTINNNAEVTAETVKLVEELKDYVDHYFDNLDVQTEINNKINAMVEDGTFAEILGAYVQPQIDQLTGDVNLLQVATTDLQNGLDGEVSMRTAEDNHLQTQINGLASGSPLVASSTAGMTDTSRVYVNTTDGNWYYYDGDSWEIGGVYQASEIECDTTLTESGVPADAKAVGDILFDSDNGILTITNPTVTAKEEGKYINSVGNISPYADTTAYSTAIAVKKGDTITAHLMANTAMCAICYCDANVNSRSVAVVGRSYNVEDYVLTSDRDGYIAISYYMANDHTVQIKHHEFADYKEKVDDIEDATVKVEDEAITVSTGAGYYIGGNNGVPTANASYDYTDKIAVNKGDVIYANMASGTAIAAISYVSADMTFIRPVVVATGYNKQIYEYTCPYTGYIVLCYQNAIEASLQIKRNKVENLENIQPLKDKFIVWCGDSIMRGNAFNDTHDGWAGRVCDLSDCHMINYGVGGSTITNNVTGGGTPTIYQQIETAHTAYPDADYVIFDGGCNDADLIGSIIIGSTPPKFGTWSANDFSGSYDTDTFCGAFETICMHLSQYWLGKHVGYIVPQKMGVANNYDAEHNNYRAYYETAIQICNKWGISVLNMWDGTYLNPKHNWMCDTNNTMTPEQIYAAGFLYADRQHLTSAGYDYESTIVNDWVKSL